MNAVPNGPWEIRPSINPITGHQTSLDICHPVEPGARGVAVVATVFEDEEVARLIATAPEIFAMLSALEWAGQVDHPQGGTEDGCPYCDAAKRWGHVPDCKLAALLNKVRGEQVPA